MIDHPEITQRLIEKLNEALPLPARLTPELQDLLRRQTSSPTIQTHATVTWISYAGDEGGIVCKLDLGPDVEDAAFTSITHLRFHPARRWREKSPSIRSPRQAHPPSTLSRLSGQHRLPNPLCR